MVLISCLPLHIHISLSCLFQLSLCILTELSVGIESCSVVTKPLLYQSGGPTGNACSFITGRAAECSIMCGARPQCRFVYDLPCTAAALPCQCAFCDELLDISFGGQVSKFYLYTQMIGANTGIISLPGGPVVGQPLLLEVKLKGNRVSLNLQAGLYTTAFFLEIRFDEASVVSNSYINNYYGSEDRYMPHFNFAQEQIISVFYAVTSTEFVVYIDQVFFRRFQHRIALDQITEFRLTSDYGLATVISFRR